MSEFCPNEIMRGFSNVVRVLSVGVCHIFCIFIQYVIYTVHRFLLKEFNFCCELKRECSTNVMVQTVLTGDTLGTIQ